MHDAHGDMGIAFDYDLDGYIDLLSGDDDNGAWHLYRNVTWETILRKSKNNYVLVHIGYSRKGVDAMGAEIKLTTDSGIQFKRVGSGSASHSQSLLNIVHFGLGKTRVIEEIDVRWRDSSTAQLNQIMANQLIVIGNIQN